jgi:hypothetical protein
MKLSLKILLGVAGIIIIGMSIQFILAFLLAGYVKITEWIFGDWNLIGNPVLAFFLALGFIVLFAWLINLIYS